MKPTIKSEFQRIVAAHNSSRDAKPPRKKLRNDLVTVKWNVTYDELGHDIILRAKIIVNGAKDALLQVWLKDNDTELGIPEWIPWIASVVEFSSAQEMKEAKLVLFDSKWQAGDKGKKYVASLWGYVLSNGKPEKFQYEKEFTFPG